MKIGHPVLLICLSFVCMALHGEGAEPGPTVLARGLFSYQAPPGWQTSASPVSPYPVSSEGWYRPHEARILVNIVTVSQGVSDYVTQCLQALRSGPDYAHVLDRRPFVTAAGLDGIRATVNIRGLRQIFYFFDGGSGKIIIVNACCLLRDADRDTPLFDASLKTFSLE
jgi:hypothetical protein